jgi:hypothetical protein
MITQAKNMSLSINVKDGKNWAYKITGWWYTYPSEKYESQMGVLFPIYGKIKNVPNHQPDHVVYFKHNMNPMRCDQQDVVFFDQ